MNFVKTLAPAAASGARLGAFVAGAMAPVMVVLVVSSWFTKK